MPEPERRLAETRVALLGPSPPDQLAGADQRGRALELLRVSKPQRVAHQHRHAVRPSRPLDDALETADREGERGQAEVRLGLAAAGREEEQVDEPGPGPLGMRRDRRAPGG